MPFGILCDFPPDKARFSFRYAGLGFKVNARSKVFPNGLTRLPVMRRVGRIVGSAVRASLKNAFSDVTSSCLMLRGNS